MTVEHARDRREGGETAIRLNGEPQSLPAALTLTDLLARLELQEDAVAIERNREIVQRGEWGCTVLESGDSIEIVHFVGGG